MADEPVPLVPPTHVCAACGARIYVEEGIGWVDCISGDDGGTYDMCPETWISEAEGFGPHRPGSRLAAVR